MKTIERIELETGKALLTSAAENLKVWLAGGFLPEWAIAAINELVEQEAWEELNDRFYQYMKFGTGGLRGRTIGRIPAPSELEDGKDPNRPRHAAIGTNVLNDFNVIRGTVGLYRYAQRYLEGSGRGWERPRIVIAHDVRFFSRHFCELAASTWCRLGGDAFIFDGPRSTPQLSFTVRFLKATAGVVITASHNPPHDNGFKAYFQDGAQIVTPHAEGVIEAVMDVALGDLPGFLEKDLERVVTLGVDADEAYLAALRENIVDSDLIAEERPKVVFTPIHGTGAVSSVPAMRRLGIEVVEVPEQMVQDSRFPTVKSPNPENAEALELGIRQGIASGAGIVIATDPDADRMGVAVADGTGGMTLLTGNMIGSILAEARLQSLFDAGILNDSNKGHAALIKTFVTTPLQAEIARANGIRCIDTLTGFKWIGEKLAIYEAELKAAIERETGIVIDYDATPAAKRRDLHLRYGTFYVFGGEESYGYLASDAVRDKDANAAVLLFCELAARLQREGRSFLEYLDAIYLKYGYYRESLVNVYYEGAAGAAKIAAILDSYRENPPSEMNGVAVTRFLDFGREVIHDADGKQIPSQDFYRLELANGYSYAVRGSGTEPKIKFYTFGNAKVSAAGELETIRETVVGELDALGEAIRADAEIRASAG